MEANQSLLPLCDYDTCMLLKSAGFNLPTYFYFHGNIEGKTGIENYDAEPENYNFDYSASYCSRPTIYEAAKWLRDSKGIHVCPWPTYNSTGIIYMLLLCQIENDRLVNEWIQDDTFSKQFNAMGMAANEIFETHDSALEKGIITACNQLTKNK